MARDRRRFLMATATFGMAALSVRAPVRGAALREKPAEEGISAIEDLMREHGVLARILLIFEEGLRRLRSKRKVSPGLFHQPAELVRSFVEDYHERLEEKFIFPEFEKRRTLADLVRVLRGQHAAGRVLTDVILRNSAGHSFADLAHRELSIACEAFARMYRPHKAREDTVLFPALHRLLPAAEIAELGEKFEEEEDRLFGEGGFEKTADRVAAIEKELGIYDLAQFTPAGSRPGRK
jgi:hemerythrin-like domain-containing protein